MNERIEKAYAQRPKRWVFELSVAVIVTALIVWSATAVETSGTTQNGGKIALNILSGIFHPDTGLLFNLTVQGVPYLLLETVCVCIYHGGFEEDLHTGAVLSGSGENLACRIARELDFDLLLTGHQHMPVESVRIGGTFAVQPPANAGRYLQVEAAVRDGGAEFSARLLPVGGIHREQPYRRLLPLEQAAQRWLDEPVGHLEQAIPP